MTTAWGVYLVGGGAAAALFRLPHGEGPGSGRHAADRCVYLTDAGLIARVAAEIEAVASDRHAPWPEVSGLLGLSPP